MASVLFVGRARVRSSPRDLSPMGARENPMGPYSFTFVSRIDRSKILRSSGRHEAPEYGIPSRSHAHHIRFHSFPETNPLAVPGVRLEPSAEAASSRHRPSRTLLGAGHVSSFSVHQQYQASTTFGEVWVEPQLNPARDLVSLRVTAPPHFFALQSLISDLQSPITLPRTLTTE